MKTSKIIILVFVLITQAYWACDACKLQQPKLTQNFTHGAGPQSNWDWVIVSSIALITVYTLIYSVIYLIKPGENKGSHIKNRIIDYGDENGK